VSSREAFTATWTNAGNPNQGIIAVYRSCEERRLPAGGSPILQLGRRPWTQRPSGVVEIDRTSPQARGLVARFSGGQLIDGVNGQALTLTGLVSRGFDYRFGQAFQFTGNSTSQAVVYRPQERIAGAITLCGWVRADGPNLSGSPLSIVGHTALPGSGRVLCWNGTYATLGVTGVNTNNFGSGFNTYGEWRFIAASIDASNNLIGCLGNPNTGAWVAETQASYAEYDTTAAYVEIGNRWVNGDSWRFNGLIAEASVYNRALSERELRAKFEFATRWSVSTPAAQRNRIVVPSTYAPSEPCAFRGAPALRMGRKTPWAHEKGLQLGYSASTSMKSYDASRRRITAKGADASFQTMTEGVALMSSAYTGLYYDFAPLVMAVPFTIAAWALKRENTAAKDLVLVTSGANHATNVYGAGLSMGSTAGWSVSYYSGSTSGPANRRSATGNVLDPARLYHLVGVCRGATDWSLYQDGVEITPTLSGTSSSGLVNEINGVTIGAFGRVNNISMGIGIADARVYDYALTWWQAYQLYLRTTHGNLHAHSVNRVYTTVPSAYPGMKLRRG